MQVTVDPTARFIGAHHDILVGLTRLRLLAQLSPSLPEEQRLRLTQGLLDLGRHGIIDHHADEESVLFARMLEVSKGTSDHERVEAMILRLTREHRTMESIWKQLEPVLVEIEAGCPTDLPLTPALQLVEKYQAHTQFEESVVLPLANSLLDNDEKSAMDANLRLRHKVDNLPTYI